MPAGLDTGIAAPWMSCNNHRPIGWGVASNYRPQACLPIMWKLLTQIIIDEICAHIDRNSLLQNEQKVCGRGCGGAKDQLIDNTILRSCRKAKKSSHQIYRLQESTQHGVPFLLKRETKNYESVTKHLVITRSEHA